jgi:hypothetical protein
LFVVFGWLFLCHSTCAKILGHPAKPSINFRAGGLQDGILTIEGHNPLRLSAKIAF